MTFAALAAMAGILLAQLGPPFALLTACVLPLFVPRRPARQLPGWLALVTLGFAMLHRVACLPDQQLAGILAQSTSPSIPIRFSGVVLDIADREGFPFHLATLTQGQTIIPAHNRVRLQVATQRLHPGDRLTGSGRLSAIPGPRNPGEPAQDSDFRAIISVASFHQLHIEGVSLRSRAEQFASLCRAWIGDAITRGIPPGNDAAGLIQAMVLGERGETSRETVEAFRKSGAMHLFSVSGLHVAIFASVIWALLRPFPISRAHSVLIIAAAAFFYAFVTGLSPPAVRAAAMLTVVLSGFALRRQARILNSLGLAAILILAANTRQLFDIGFQLSFSVMAAIALLGPRFERFCGTHLAPDPFIPRSLALRHRRPWESPAQHLAGLMSVSLAAWIGALPLTLWYFGQLSLVSIPANCVLIPVSFLVMAGATSSLGLTILHLPGLPLAINRLTGWCAALLQGLASFFAHLPGATVELTPLEIAFSGLPQAQPSLIVFDLRQSCAAQAIVLPAAADAPDLPVWLIDPGDYRSYATHVRPWIRAQGIHELEGLVLTHGDSQHVDAARFCLRDFAIRRLVFSPHGGRSSTWRQLHQQPLTPNQIRMELATGSHLNLAPELNLRVLFPPPGFPDQALADDECLVLLLEWHGWRILSLADSGFTTEKWLLEHQPDLRCDVLIRSPHCRDASTLPEFLNAVCPKCVISTNYSFPPSERIPDSLRAELAARDIRLFDLAGTGAVTLRPGPDELILEPYLGGKPEVIVRGFTKIPGKSGLVK